MIAAKRIEETCSCGTYPEAYCEGCGEPLCIDCLKIEITGVDASRVSQKIFCHACHRDPGINVWGADYWPGLTALFL